MIKILILWCMFFLQPVTLFAASHYECFKHPLHDDLCVHLPLPVAEIVTDYAFPFKRPYKIRIHPDDGRVLCFTENKGKHGAYVYNPSTKETENVIDGDVVSETIKSFIDYTICKVCTCDDCGQLNAVFYGRTSLDQYEEFPEAVNRLCLLGKIQLSSAHIIPINHGNIVAECFAEKFVALRVRNGLHVSFGHGAYSFLNPNNSEVPNGWNKPLCAAVQKIGEDRYWLLNGYEANKLSIVGFIKKDNRVVSSDYRENDFVNVRQIVKMDYHNWFLFQLGQEKIILFNREGRNQKEFPLKSELKQISSRGNKIALLYADGALDICSLPDYNWSSFNTLVNVPHKLPIDTCALNPDGTHLVYTTCEADESGNYVRMCDLEDIWNRSEQKRQREKEEREKLITKNTLLSYAQQSTSRFLVLAHAQRVLHFNEDDKAYLKNMSAIRARMNMIDYMKAAQPGSEKLRFPGASFSGMMAGLKYSKNQ